MLFNKLILLLLFFRNKTLVSALLARFAHGLDVRKFQGFFSTLLVT
ncbi:hypothetical protein SAMN04488491_1618 [Psychrobacter sp. LV10R520-6]|nr:hypothetical protein SAMN04488491_1618 [Psychrobacter sp. LV10R520-6]